MSRQIVVRMELEWKWTHIVGAIYSIPQMTRYLTMAFWLYLTTNRQYFHIPP
jgi:hypothetical protein